MSTVKRFYWIKLKESFMTSDTVDYLMSRHDGANYVVLYQMLCLKTINTDGKLSRTIGEVVIPYDVEKIQRDCKWFSIDTIRVALSLYKAFGLIYEEHDGTLVMADHENLVGSETDAAARMRNSRAARNALPSSDVTDDEQSANIVTPDIRDKRLEIRDKDARDIESNSEDTGKEVCVETDSVSTPPPVPHVIALPLIDGTAYDVTKADIDKYGALYPAVDILQELRGMLGWLDANPKRKKTRNGIKRFINNWLAGEQDRGGKLRGQSTKAAAVTYSNNEKPY